jgi:hypothetical protein
MTADRLDGEPRRLFCGFRPPRGAGARETEPDEADEHHGQLKDSGTPEMGAAKSM